MNKPNTEIKRWGIIVVQSLTPNDVKTGEILYHEEQRARSLWHAAPAANEMKKPIKHNKGGFGTRPRVYTLLKGNTKKLCKLYTEPYTQPYISLIFRVLQNV